MEKGKFKVGDIVRGKGSSLYRITNMNMTRGEVTRVLGNSIRVRVIEHADVGYVGSEFIVKPKYFELVGTPKPEKVVIYRNGQSVIAKDVNSGKTAEARCNPVDTFDFAVGAKLALERLTGEHSAEKARLVFNGKHCGYIGTPTNYKDAVGRPLYVGDVVETFNDSGLSYGNAFVCRSDEKAFVMGIMSSCDDDGTINDSWNVIKKKSFDDTEDGETYDGVRCVRPK